MMTSDEKTRLNVTGIRFASGLGGLLAGLTLAIEKLSTISDKPVIGAAQKTLFILLFPGIIGAMGIGGSVHSWHLWVAAVINGLIYFGIGWCSYVLVAKYRRRGKFLVTVGVILLGGISAHAQRSEAEQFQNAQHLYAIGRWPEAERSFAEIVRDHPAKIAAQMYLGQTLFKEEKFAVAIVPYEKVRALEKDGKS